MNQRLQHETVLVENVDVDPGMLADAVRALRTGMLRARPRPEQVDDRIPDAILEHGPAPGAVLAPTIEFISRTSRPARGTDLAAIALACLEGTPMSSEHADAARRLLVAAFAADAGDPAFDGIVFVAQCASPWAPVCAQGQDIMTGEIHEASPDPDLSQALPIGVRISSTVVDGREAIGISPITDLVLLPGPDAVETLRLLVSTGGGDADVMPG